MKRLLGIGMLATAVALVVGLTSAVAASHGTTVSIASTSLGRVLVDGHGHTLYLFQKDAHGRSSCAGRCADSWPPLIAAGKSQARGGARASLLGTIKRRDGRLQVTYNHHPLYAFGGDRTKGQTNGEALNAFGAEWYAIGSGGSKVESGDDQSAVENPSYGGYGY